MRVRELKTKKITCESLETHAGGAMAIGPAAVGGTLAVTGVATLSQGATLAATAASGVTHLLKDAAGKTLLATGATLPADTGALYAKGCLFIDTDVTTGTSGLYVNVGTSASCVFKLVSNAA